MNPLAAEPGRHMNPFALRAHTKRDGEQLLQLMRDAEPTYTDIGATAAGRTPSGFRGATHERVVGNGPKAFTAACDALKGWQVHHGAGAMPFNRPPLAQGETVLLTLGLAAAELRIACRIVHTIDESHRFGFSYGTLPCHPETGEEQFLVTMDNNGNVHFVITVFWKPGMLLTRLGGPVASRMQARFTERYLDAMQQAIKEEQ